MKLIVGLGNPGKEYEKTRHNTGFMVIDAFAKNHQVNIDKNKFNGLIGEFNYNDEKIILLKPLSYMNLSGEVVEKVMSFYKIRVEDLLVISDDLDQQVGNVRLRSHGSAGGHNGLKNIESHIHTDCYKRLRIGISKNKAIDTADYVLGKFPKEDLKILEDKMPKYINILNDYLNISFEELMSRYNSNK